MQRKLPSPGFLLEIVMADYDGTAPFKANSDSATSEQNSGGASMSSSNEATAQPKTPEVSKKNEENVFSDSEGEETAGQSKTTRGEAVHGDDDHERHGVAAHDSSTPSTNQTESLAERAEQLSHSSDINVQAHVPGEAIIDVSDKPTSDHDIAKTTSGGISDFKAIAADASVFTFCDEDDLESD